MTSITGFDEARLADYLREHIPGFSGPLKATKFSQGQSNPTFLLEAASGKYVLRRKPPGELLKSAHAVDREFRVINALQQTDVPVARVFLLCDDDSVIGSMFYVMEYLEGRVLWDPKLPELGNRDREEIYDEMNRVLAALHSVNVEQAGLGDYGPSGNYYERQLNRWIKQYRASELATVPDMEELMRWLPDNTPTDDGRVSLVHGDFRLDNMMFAKDSNQVIALLDWELSTLGHPFSDLAYQCMQWRVSNDAEIQGLAGVDRAGLGIPSEQDYVAAYCRRMGLDSIPDWNFYVAFSAFRLAAILQGVKKRSVDGNASSDRAHKMGELVPVLARIGTELIR